MAFVDFLDDVRDDDAALSVAIDASTANGIAVSISRDRGTDSIVLSYLDCDPVPFEDLAVVVDTLELDELLARGGPRPG